MKKYWMLFEHYICPVCEREIIYRRRTFIKTERGHTYITDYDYCLE